MKLHEVTVCLSNNKNFKIWTNVEPELINAAIINWEVRTKKYTDRSLCNYINEKRKAGLTTHYAYTIEDLIKANIQMEDKYKDFNEKSTKTSRFNSSKPNQSGRPQSVKPPTTGDNAVKGVKNFLRGKINEEDFEILLDRYNNQELKIKLIDFEGICEEIQKDFGKFVKWFKDNYKK